jgi:hypothetical protein
MNSAQAICGLSIVTDREPPRHRSDLRVPIVLQHPSPPAIQPTGHHGDQMLKTAAFLIILKTRRTIQ